MSVEPAIASGSRDAVAANIAATSIDEHTGDSKDPIVRIFTATSSAHPGPNVGHPQEQLEVDEAGTNETEDTTVYPTGAKLWLTAISLLISLFLNGLDIAIVAVAVPSLTDQFKTLSDIGWYSAAYGLVASSCIFFFGKCYTVFSTKRLYLLSLITFEIGSCICTFAPTSKAFIFGRVIAGLGAGGTGGGLLKILKDLFPMSKQGLAIGIMGAAQGVGLVSAPIVGGALIDAFSWRGCFGVNLPIGVMCILFTAWGFNEPSVLEEASLPWKEKVRRLDLVGTMMVIPSISCLLMALQWGGIKFGWSDPRIIALFVVFAVLFSSFVYLQIRLGDRATVPPRMLKNRSVLGAMLFGSCLNGILAMTEYYISIYYQGVRGYSATKSGLLGVPMLVGLLVAGAIGASGVSWIGYYYPFLLATGILTPIASGLLTTVNLDGSIVKPAALLGFVGFGVGLGINGPALVVQNTFTSKDVSIGSAVVYFTGGLGSALWICISATLFQNRLGREVQKHAPSVNVTSVEVAGLSEIRNIIGSDNLRNVLTGYNEAVVQTLYMPLGLAILSIVGALAVERKSMKKKQA